MFLLHLLYRSTGISFRQLSFSMRISKSAVASIIKEATCAIWTALNVHKVQIIVLRIHSRPSFCQAVYLELISASDRPLQKHETFRRQKELKRCLRRIFEYKKDKIPEEDQDSKPTCSLVMEFA